MGKGKSGKSWWELPKRRTAPLWKYRPLGKRGGSRLRLAAENLVTPEEIQREAMIHGDHPCRACGSWNCRIEWS